MHITRLLVQELRAIGRLELDLKNVTGEPRRRTVLLGINGAGKTTVLDAIVHAFSTLDGQHLPGYLGETRLSASDVRNVDVPSLKAAAIPRRGLIELDGLQSEEEHRVARSKFRQAPRAGGLSFDIGDAAVWEGLDPLGAFEIADGAFTFRNAVEAAIHDNNLHPVCLFLPADRGILEHRDDLTLKQIMALDSCTQSLSRKRDRFAPIAARLALAHATAQTDEGRAVARMWKVLAKHFSDLPRPISAEGGALRFRNKNGAIVPLSSLSDGERAILLIFGELALREPKSCVVLIDEIEQHLHPRWQREILAALLTMAPSAQFILTTQSPFLAACAPDDVIKLPGWDEYGE